MGTNDVLFYIWLAFIFVCIAIMLFAHTKFDLSIRKQINNVAATIALVYSACMLTIYLW